MAVGAPARGACPPDPDFDAIRGVDASVLRRIEDNAGVYTDAEAPGDALSILREHGVNFVRLRVWNDPAEGYHDPDGLLEMSERIHAAGMGLLVDFHYSDTWADPGSQSKPAAWTDLAFDDLRAVVRAFTADTVGSLVAQGTPPEMIQVGNEISNGFLWPDGRLDGSPDGNWPHFTALLSAAIAGVRDAEPTDRPIEVVIHYDDGGSNPGARWFFDNLQGHAVPFDTIGLSFYPWWHGTLGDLETNMADLAARYARRVVVLETAYPWTLTWADATSNIVGLPSQLHPGYDASPEGQRAFVADVLDLAARAQAGHRGGVFYWGCEWITTPGFGSPWENLALFDFQGETLDALEEFDRAHTLDRDADGCLTVDDLYAIHTTPTDTDLDGDADLDDVRLLQRAIRRQESAVTLARPE